MDAFVVFISKVFAISFYVVLAFFVCILFVAVLFRLDLLPSRYPIDVCSCSEIANYNSNEVCMGYKHTNVDSTILGPTVELVKAIRDDAIIVSNLINRKPDFTKKSQIYRERYRGYEAGYFLHQCGGIPLFVPLGMDREKAIALGLKLVAEAPPAT